VNVVSNRRSQDQEPGSGDLIGESAIATTHAIVDDTYGFAKSVVGIQIEALQIGRGTNPSTVNTIRDDRLIATSCQIGFPMLTRATIGDDSVLVTRITSSAVPGSRGIDFKPGIINIYGPGSKHTGICYPGLSYTFVVIQLARLAELAKGLRSSIAPPPRGQVYELHPSLKTRSIGFAIDRLVDIAGRDLGTHHTLVDDVLCSTTSALSEEERIRRVGGGKRIDSRSVVLACIGYAESIERIPSVGELTLVAHVSERRLREAFSDVYDMPPTRFFRAWALQEAHRRLRRDEAQNHTVSYVAATLGFGHLGRFAAHYKQIYGECPSTTLRSNSSRCY
jgi:AraC-like DNA-binding protein